jgi:hypothetical protein
MCLSLTVIDLGHQCTTPEQCYAPEATFAKSFLNDDMAAMDVVRRLTSQALSHSKRLSDTIIQLVCMSVKRFKTI